MKPPVKRDFAITVCREEQAMDRMRRDAAIAAINDGSSDRPFGRAAPLV
jgi:hypothetical protein